MAPSLAKGAEATVLHPEKCDLWKCCCQYSITYAGYAYVVGVFFASQTKVALPAMEKRREDVSIAVGNEAECLSLKIQ